MDQYEVTLTGLTPLLIHSDNLAFGEKVKAWQKDPHNNAAQARKPPEATGPEG